MTGGRSEGPAHLLWTDVWVLLSVQQKLKDMGKGITPKQLICESKSHYGLDCQPVILEHHLSIFSA